MRTKIIVLASLALSFPFFTGCEFTTTTSGVVEPTTETWLKAPQQTLKVIDDEQAEELLDQFGAKISRNPDQSLKVLKLDKCDADDSLLPWIGKQTSLVELSLVQTKITDDGVTHLAPLKNLKKLRIGSNGITDKSAVSLGQLSALEDLDVSNTALGNDAMKEIGKLTNLKKLNLYTTKITDSGVDALAPLVNLTWLNLDNCPITDAAIAKLQVFQKLEWLHLGRTPLTDAGLKELAELQKDKPAPLKEVHISRTQITPEGATQFKSTFPDCVVHDTVENSGR